MSPERWERLSAIYHAALTRDPAARTPFVHQACGNDEALRHEVLSLLAKPSGDGLPGVSGLPIDSGSAVDAVDDAEAPMSDLAGRQFGPYRILEVLGVGGMGHVYRARDTTLDRDVAIKMLPRGLATDTDRLARFDREAHVLAALNHAHIGAIYGFVEVDGGRGLVLELVEGATLAERLRKGPIPVTEAIDLGDQIAQALDAAHQAGVVHRDLKPANIKVRPDGTLKVLDFGLAKVTSPESDSDVATHHWAQVSSEGLVVGTPAYMSPEQARGQPVDRRADIWAFGCVLVEMLTGRAAFGRATASDTIAAILDHEPDWSLLPAATPAHVRRLLRRCLAKSPHDRLRDIGDARADLTEPASGEHAGNSERAGVHALPWRHLRLALATTFGAVAGIGAWSLWAPASNPAPAVTSRPSPSPTALQRVTYDDTYVEGPAISPDGTLIAYASDRGGADNLDIWLQHVAGGSPVRVTTSEADDRQPTFSPDGGQILFRSEAQGGGLYVVPTLGGAPRLVARSGVRARYSPDGTKIAYWVGSEIGFGMRGLEYRTFVVPTGGGAPSEITGFTGVRFPLWSPDSRHLVVAASRASEPNQASYDWWVVRLDDGQAVETSARDALQSAGALSSEGLVPPPYAWSGGRILTSAAGGVWSLQLDGNFSAVSAERLTFGPGEASEPSISRDGLVAFVGSTSTQGVWALPIDPETAVVRGAPTPLTSGAGPFGRGAFSADGRLLAYQATRASVAILVQDVTTGQVRDLGVAARPYGPVPAPDGAHVAVPMADGGVSIVPTGGGPARRVCDNCESGTWTSDSRRVTWSWSGRTRDIHVLDLASGTTTQPLDRSGLTTNRPHLSHDDRWLAFRGFDPDRGAQVFVAPMQDTPVPQSAWINISGDFERDARPTAWSPRGRMVYFLSSRDGFRCLYARPWDGERGQLRGPVQLVRHFHNLRIPGSGGASVISTGAGNAISLNRFVFDFEVTKGDVWTMRMPVGANR